MSAAFSLVLDAQCALGESPVWWAAARKLVFVDITGRRLHRFDPVTGQHEVDPVAEDIGCVAPAKGGGYVAGLRSGMWLLDAAGVKVRELAPNLENNATHRFNDGRVDPRGRYFSGTLDESKAAGDAGLYRFDKSGVAKLADGIMTSNGLAFSPDGRTLYFSDTPRFVIYRFDYDPDAGAATNRRVFARLEPTATDRGRPDGAAVDVEADAPAEAGPDRVDRPLQGEADVLRATHPERHVVRVSPGAIRVAHHPDEAHRPRRARGDAAGDPGDHRPMDR